MDIDVSKCAHYNKGNCDNDNTMCVRCSDNNCFFKQIQQLQTKNYKLTEVIKTQNKQLEQLQNEIETIHEDRVRLWSDNTNFNRQLQQANAKLEKIKEIADGTYPSGGRYIGKKDILKIIESEE